MQDKHNDLPIASGAMDIVKEQMHKWLNLFITLMNDYYANTEYYRARTDSMGIGAGEEKFYAPLRDARSLWGKLNAPNGPPEEIVLPVELNEGIIDAEENFTVAAFSTDRQPGGCGDASHACGAHAGGLLHTVRAATDWWRGDAGSLRHYHGRERAVVGRGGNAPALDAAGLQGE